MTKFRITTVALATVFAAALVAGPVSAAKTPPKAGAKCTKAGATAKAGTVSLVCTKKGTKLVWVAKKSTVTPSGKTIEFSGRYTGTATVKTSGARADITAEATGSGTLIGSSKLTGEGVGNVEAKPCPVFTGPGTIQGAGGAKISFTVNPTSTGCPDADDANQAIIAGLVTVKGGTGAFAKASGVLRVSGLFDRKTGALSVTFTGTIKL